MKLYLLILLIGLSSYCYGQDRKETTAYLNYLKQIVSSEKSANHLLYRLDTAVKLFIPSRSGVSDFFNRKIDFEFKHRLINIRLNFAAFQIDLLSLKDTIQIVSIKSIDYKSVNYDSSNKPIIDDFLKKRNQLYNSSKTKRDLINELSANEQYAFYCGDGMAKTKEGKHIEQLVEDENVDELTALLKSFSCERQAYGVAGFSMLEKTKGYSLPTVIQKLITYIKSRNSEVITCSGCIAGLVEKVYAK